MKIQSISQINSDKQNFCAIKSKDFLGGFAWDYTKSAKDVYDAFENSLVLQKFCNNNDVKVSYILNAIGNYNKAATLKIEKIFPKEKSIVGMFLSLFKPKKEQVIYINSFDLSSAKAKEELAEKISKIKNDSDILNYWRHPYDEFNGTYSKAPHWTRVVTNKNRSIY